VERRQARRGGREEWREGGGKTRLGRRGGGGVVVGFDVFSYPVLARDSTRRDEM
jgi:hypothetical protein